VCPIAMNIERELQLRIEPAKQAAE